MYRSDLQTAAKFLKGEILSAGESKIAEALLEKFGATDLRNTAQGVDLAKLLAVSEHLERFFALTSLEMDGLKFFGAQVNPKKYGARWGETLNASGVGRNVLDALCGCLGEVVEKLCQFEYASANWPRVEDDIPGNEVKYLSRFQSIVDREELDCEPIDWVKAEFIGAKEQIYVPLDLCWRRAPERRNFEPAYAPGSGCAAGATIEDATFRALLEIIERDALALWWEAGRRGYGLPVNGDTLAGANETLKRLRAVNSRRKSWFLDITTDIGIPVIVAMSCALDETGFAFGASAGLTIDSALNGAISELGQLELADLIVQSKLDERGYGGLNETDLKHKARTQKIHRDWLLLQPVREPGRKWYDDTGENINADATNNRLTSLAENISNQGFKIVRVDLTHPNFSVPVARVMIPGLQPYPASFETRRLKDNISLQQDIHRTDRPAIF